jgi:hypothetical protein
MTSRELIFALNESPIERIVRRVLGRKMTKAEKLLFHLKPTAKRPPQKGTPSPS